MKTYEAASILTTIAFSLTLLINSFLIFLTIFHIKLITGTYKWMMVIFATLGILFAFLEVTARPCVHNFNGGWIFFSLNVWLPSWLVFFLTASYSGFFCSLLTFINVQFIFRCWTIIGSELIDSFRGFKVLLWILFVITPSALFANAFIILTPPDDFVDGYMRLEFEETYDLPIEQVTRFILIAYNSDGTIRWQNVSFIFVVSAILITILMVIGYSALRMRKEMKARFDLMSRRNMRLETQFFKALVAQSAFPTVLLVLPIGPVMLLPLLDLKISWQSGFMFSLFSLYPPLDSIAMMMIITEYKACMKKLLNRLLCCCCANKVSVPQGNCHSEVDTSFQLSVIPPDHMRCASAASSFGY